MLRVLLKILVLVYVLATVSCQLIPSSSTTTPILVKQHGYPLEEQIVQTTDGYILTMHRIPYSPKLNNNGTARPVAFLMHCLVCSSAVWVLGGPKRSLAYILSDLGYDVWMGNARGNVYSRKHVILSPLTQPFWNFTFQEIAIYDQPAMIDYALEVTGEQQVRFIGHSQGTTTFFILNALLPSYVKSRIRSVHLLAPVVYLKNSPSFLMTYLAPTFAQPNPSLEITGSIEVLPNYRALELFADQACKDGSLPQDACADILFIFSGARSPYLNETQLPEIISIVPAGSSLNPFLHYGQFYNSGQFRQFDYGSLRNLQVYGRVSPPNYDLANLEVPTYLYYGDNDIYVNLIDLAHLVRDIKGTTGFRGAYKVPLTGWNHVDFIVGLGAENFLYNVVLDDIAKS